MRRNADDGNAAPGPAQFTNKLVSLAIIQIIINENQVETLPSPKLARPVQAADNPHRMPGEKQFCDVGSEEGMVFDKQHSQHVIISSLNHARAQLESVPARINRKNPFPSHFVFSAAAASRLTASGTSRSEKPARKHSR